MSFETWIEIEADDRTIAIGDRIEVSRDGGHEWKAIGIITDDEYLELAKLLIFRVSDHWPNGVAYRVFRKVG